MAVADQEEAEQEEDGDVEVTLGGSPNNNNVKKNVVKKIKQTGHNSLQCSCNKGGLIQQFVKKSRRSTHNVMHQEGSHNTSGRPSKKLKIRHVT